MLCRVCTLQIQPRQYALEHAVCVAPIPQRELDHTDQGYICPERLARAVGIDTYLSDVRNLPIYLQYDSTTITYYSVTTTTITTTATTTTICYYC